MRQYLDIDPEGPDFSKVLIISVVFHLIFLALVMVPLGEKENEQEGYLVELVTPAELQTAIHDKLALNTLPVKKIEAPIDGPERQIPRAHYSGINGNHRVSPGNEMETRNDARAAQNSYRRDSVPLDSGLIQTSALTKDNMPMQSYSITRNKESGTISTTAKDMSQERYEKLGTGFEYDGGDIMKKGDALHEIVSAGASGESSPGGALSQGRDNMLPVKEFVPGKPGMMPGTDIMSATEGIGRRRSIGESAGPGIIQRAGLSGNGTGAGSANKRHVSDINRNVRAKGGDVQFGDGTGSAADAYIRGVSLGDLTACAHALDEGNLKKKILSIIGDKKECYSERTGKYMFHGSGRYTSFEMIIVPVAGRILSSRCDELRNALSCLDH